MTVKLLRIEVVYHKIIVVANRKYLEDLRFA